MFCLVTLGNGIQGGSKLITFIVGKNKIIELTKIGDNFLKYATESDLSKNSILNWMNICYVMTKSITNLFFSLSVLVFLYPVIFYLIFGESILHFGFVIPGIDATTIHGYLINFCHHTLQIYIVCFALVLTLCLNIIFISLALLQYNALINQLSLLDDEIQKSSLNQTIIDKMISQIIEQHTELLKYLKLFNEIFSIYYFVEISSIAFQKTVTLFTLSINMSFFAGYPILLADVFQIFAPCLLGTILELQSENFLKSINEISWTKMPVKQQKSLHFIILASQKRQHIASGFFKLNLPGFVSVSVNYSGNN
jgi:hypothetical protein